MKYKLNIAQRTYISENKFMIELYKKLFITVYKKTKIIVINLDDNIVFQDTFDDETYNIIKHNADALLFILINFVPLDKYIYQIIK